MIFDYCISSITRSSPFFHHGTFSWYSPSLSYCSNLPSAASHSTQSKVHTPRPASKLLPHMAQPPAPDTGVLMPSCAMFNSPHLQQGRALLFLQASLTRPLGGITFLVTHFRACVMLTATRSDRQEGLFIFCR